MSVEMKEKKHAKNDFVHLNLGLKMHLNFMLDFQNAMRIITCVIWERNMAYNLILSPSAAPMPFAVNATFPSQTTNDKNFVFWK